MKKLLIISLVCLTLSAYSQTVPTLIIGTVCNTAPGNVNVPITVQNFTDVGSVSFKIGFDITKLTFNNLYTVNPLLDGGFFVLNPNANDSIAMAWFSMVPINIPDDDALITLEFFHSNGNASINFPLAAGTNYVNGGVIDGQVQLIQQPDTINVMAGSPAYFQVTTNVPALTQYQWQESTDNGFSWYDLSNTGHYHGTNTDLLVIDTVSLSMNSFLYRCQILNCSGSNSDPALLEVNANSSLSGQLTYLNTNNSGISNTVIFFWHNGNIAYTTTTDSLGNFELPFMVADTYDIQVNCLKPWGGGNAVDGLMILQHFTSMLTLNGLPLEAADVDISGAVNAVDALLVVKRFVGMISSFLSGDWVFDTTQVVILPSQPNYINIRGLCYGDVNGSYVP